MSTYTIGSLNQLGDALERIGFTAKDVTKLRTHPYLELLLFFARNQAEIVVKKHLIDCDADPYVPEDWKVKEHIKGGQFQWDANKVILHLVKEPTDRNITGKELHKKVIKQFILNANVLDYLLKYPELIPEDWKGKDVYFWGTLYHHPDGLCVRYLHWNGNKWHWNYYWLNNHWLDFYVAVVSCK